MQLGHHDLRGGNFFAVDVHVVDGNAAAVVDHGDGVIEVDGDFDLVGVTGERFVDRVVHDFVHQVVQTHFAGRADVHGGTFAHRFHAAENFDGVGGVVSVAAVDGGELSVFCLSFVDGSDFFRGHSAPWRMPDLSPGRRAFPMPWNCLKLLKLLTLTASELYLIVPREATFFDPRTGPVNPHIPWVAAVVCSTSSAC